MTRPHLRILRLLLLPVVAALVLTAVPSSAGAAVAPDAPVWLPPAQLDAAAEMADPDVAANARGDVVVSYTRTNGSTGPTRQAVVRVRPVGTGFSSSFAVSPSVTPTVAPQVGITADGRVVAAWVEPAGFQSRVAYRTRAVGGLWSPTTYVRSTIEVHALRLAVSPTGRVGLVWTDSASGGQPESSGVLYRAFGSVTSGLEAAAPVGGEPGQTQPDLAFNASGQAVLAWTQWYASMGIASDIAVCVRPVGTASCPIELIDERRAAEVDEGDDALPSGPSVAVNASGDAVVVFETGGPLRSTGGAGVGFAVRDVTTSFTGASWTPGRLAAAPGESTDLAPDVVLRDDGTAVLAYQGYDEALRVAVRPPGVGGFGDHRTMAYVRGRSDLALGAGGDVVLTAGTWSPSGQAVSTAVMPRGSTAFGPLRSLTRSGSVLTTAAGVDDQGNGLVAVAQRGDGTSTIWTTGLDGAAPALSVAGPTQVGRGKPVNLRAVVGDRMSSVSVAWRVGGVRRTGLRLSVRLRTPGTYAVVVTATDAVGHTTTTTRRLRVV